MNNRKTILFIDDLNTSLTEKYGAKPPLELIRNLIDHGRIYDKLAYMAYSKFQRL
jgi:dynein heavy chain